MIILADRAPISEVIFGGLVTPYIVYPPAELNAWQRLYDSDPFGRPNGCASLPVGHWCDVLLPYHPGVEHIVAALEPRQKAQRASEPRYLVCTQNGREPSVAPGFDIEPAAAIAKDVLAADGGLFVAMCHHYWTIMPTRSRNNGTQQRWRVELRARFGGSPWGGTPRRSRSQRKCSS